jgi:hypothetical protein
MTHLTITLVEDQERLGVDISYHGDSMVYQCCRCQATWTRRRGRGLTARQLWVQIAQHPCPPVRPPLPEY